MCISGLLHVGDEVLEVEGRSVTGKTPDEVVQMLVSTRGVQYVMKTAQYIPNFNIYTLHNYFHLKVCFLAK